MPEILSLTAPEDRSKPIQFWQLYSVLGQDRIVAIVRNFYERVFADEEWFRSVFARVGGVNHHIGTQASMWIDAMGGGLAYHGGEYRLAVHHQYNAITLMNEKGAERWARLMVDTLDASAEHMTDDPRVRPAINTFMAFFFDKYGQEFSFNHRETFGETNPPVRRKINFMNMTEDAIEALSEDELRDGLVGRGVDISGLGSKRELVNKALSL